MPSPVPQVPSTNVLARLAVGNTVSGAAHLRRWAQDLAALIGYLEVPAVADVILPPGGAATDTITLAYNPSVGPAALAVAVEFYGASGFGARGTVTVGTGGALFGATWIAANLLDGSGTIDEIANVRLEYPVVTGFLNIEAVARGTTGTLTVTHADAAASCAGIRRLCVYEVPRAAFDPVGAPTTEPAVDQSWCGGGSPIVDGSNAVARGMYRIIDDLDTARFKLRRHWQIAALQASSITRAFSTTSAAFANPNWVLHARTPTWQFRGRALYGTGVKNKGSLRVTYACSNAAALAVVRVVVTPVGGAAINYDVTTNAGGSTAFQTATLTGVDIPNTGTLQEVTLQVQFKTSVGTLYVSNVAWTEAEV